MRENKAIWEIGELISVKYTFWTHRELTLKEFLESYEYKKFKKKYPIICEFAENYKG